MRCLWILNLITNEVDVSAYFKFIHHNVQWKLSISLFPFPLGAETLLGLYRDTIPVEPWSQVGHACLLQGLEASAIKFYAEYGKLIVFAEAKNPCGGLVGYILLKGSSRLYK